MSFILNPGLLIDSSYIITKIYKSQRLGLVTHFYPPRNGPLRHSYEEYRERFHRLFKLVDHPLHCFLSEKSMEILHVNRTFFPQNVILHVINDEFYSMCKMNQFYPKYQKIAEKYKHMVDYILSAELGVIWNNKMCLIDMILKTKQYDYIFYIDGGLVRNSKDYNNTKFPSFARILSIMDEFPNRILITSRELGNKAIKKLVRVKVPHLRTYNFGQRDIILAGCFGGSTALLPKFIEYFWYYHNVYLRQQKNVLREELIMSTVCLFKPEICVLLKIAKGTCRFEHSGIGFLLYQNRCNLENKVYYFKKNENYLRIIEYPLVHWVSPKYHIYEDSIFN